MTVTFSRSQIDCSRYVARLTAAFPNLLMPSFPDEGKLSDVIPAVLQKQWWLSCLLKFIGTVDELVNCEETIKFIDPMQPQSGPLQVRLKLGSATLAQFDQKLTPLVHGVRVGGDGRPKGKFEASLDEHLSMLKSLAPRTQVLAAELSHLRHRVERDFGERLKHAAKGRTSGTTSGLGSPAPQHNTTAGSGAEGSGKMATAVAAAVSLFQGSRWDNVDDNALQIGDRVASGPGRIGVVMYLAPRGSKKGERLVGVCWDDERSGNSDGTYEGAKYFHCKPKQGSFQKSGSLYWEATEDDVLSSLAAVTAEVERTLNSNADDFGEDVVYVISAMTFYAHFLQSTALWIQSMLQYHKTLVAAEQWIQMPRPHQQKAPTAQPMLSEAEAREISNDFFELWKRSAFDFRSVWSCYSPIRKAISFTTAGRFAKIAARLEVFNAEALSQQLERQNPMASFDDVHSLFGALNLF